MAEIKQFEPQIRYVNGMSIYFKDKHSIVVYQNMMCVIFHRWFERPRGSYRNWFNFCRTLKRRNTIDSIYQIGEIADHYNIDHQTVAITTETIPPRGIKVLPEHFRYE